MSFSGKKLLHVIGDSKFGGDTVYMFTLAEMFRQSGGEVSICTTTKETIDVAKSKGFPVFLEPKIVREVSPVIDFLAVFKMAALCRREGFDIVHTHTSKGGVVGRIGARIGGVKNIVHTIHGFAFHEGTTFMKKSIYENIERIAGLFCDIAISVNHEDRITAISRRILPKDKIITIRNGVSKERIQSTLDCLEIREELKLRDDQLLVGTISRFAEQKDPFTFIRAAEIALDSGVDAKFLYAGDGSMFDEAVAYINNSRHLESFLLPGFVDNPSGYFGALDIFVTTSLYEGMPIALLEAMCAGLPLVVSDAKGNRECVTDKTALMVRVGKPQDVAEAIVKFAKSPTLRIEFGNLAKQRFLENFTVDRMLEQTSKVYKRISC